MPKGGLPKIVGQLEGRWKMGTGNQQKHGEIITSTAQKHSPDSNVCITWLILGRS